MKNKFIVQLYSINEPTNQTLSHKKPLIRKSDRNVRIKIGRPQVTFAVASKYRIYKRPNCKFPKNVLKDCVNIMKNKQVKNAKPNVKNNNKNVINLRDCADKSDDFYDKCLATYMDADMTKSKWENMRVNNEKIFHHKLYTPYKKIAAAKTKCYPEGIKITEDDASVQLQNLLDHTAERILLLCNEDQLASFQGNDLTLFLKY